MFLAQEGIIKCKREEIRPTISSEGGRGTYIYHMVKSLLMPTWG